MTSVYNASLSGESVVALSQKLAEEYDINPLNLSYHVDDVELEESIETQSLCLAQSSIF